MAGFRLPLTLLNTTNIRTICDIAKETNKKYECITTILQQPYKNLSFNTITVLRHLRCG